jgi:hypothetical protein
MTPRFVLAKYVPDLGRMEPRNVGVFVWWKGSLCARFLDADDVDDLNDVATYDRWKAFWTRMIEDGSIRPKRGKPVSVHDPSCLDALVTTQKGNYILVDSGELLKKVSKSELPNVLNYLFNELVAVPNSGAAESMSKSLATQCRHVIEKSGIAKRDGYKSKFPVKCPIYGVTRHFFVSHGLGTGKPDALFQRVSLSTPNSVNSAALMFHSLADNALIPSVRCAALVQESDINSNTAEEGVEFLSKTCTIINVDHAKEAAASVNEVAESNGQN